MNLGLFGPCAECHREHSDGNWLICHDCAAPGLRASLLWGIAHGDTEAILSALVGRALWGAA